MHSWIAGEIEMLIAIYGLLPPSELAEQHGLLVLKLSLRRAKGFSLTLDGTRAVAVNSSLPPLEQDGVLLHEIGHRVLHPGLARFFVEEQTRYPLSKFERQANIFALLYAIRWDMQRLEECGTDIGRFAKMYGLGEETGVQSLKDELKLTSEIDLKN